MKPRGLKDHQLGIYSKTKDIDFSFSPNELRIPIEENISRL